MPLKARIQVSPDGEATSVGVPLEEDTWPHYMILGPAPPDLPGEVHQPV